MITSLQILFVSVFGVITCLITGFFGTVLTLALALGFVLIASALLLIERVVIVWILCIDDIFQDTWLLLDYLF
jgi:hypothetical protein